VDDISYLYEDRYGYKGRREWGDESLALFLITVFGNAYIFYE